MCRPENVPQRYTDSQDERRHTTRIRPATGIKTPRQSNAGRVTGLSLGKASNVLSLELHLVSLYDEPRCGADPYRVTRAKRPYIKKDVHPMLVLLTEPAVRRQHPNVGLLKIASYHRALKDDVEFPGPGKLDCSSHPDLIYISGIFTYYAKKLVDLVKSAKRRYPSATILIGGVYPSLLPAHVFEQTGIHPHVGTLDHVESSVPAYDLIPKGHEFSDTSILFTTRGCWRACTFCMVPSLEPQMTVVRNWQEHILPSHKKVLLYDNNISAQDRRHRTALFDFLARSGKEVLVDNGFDCTRFDDEHADEIAPIRHSRVRFALDSPKLKPFLAAAIERCTKRKIPKGKIQVYVLCNYRDTVADAIDRCEFVIKLGAQPYPQIYRPYDMTQSRRPYVSPGWSLNELRMLRVFFTFPGLYKSTSFDRWRQSGAQLPGGSKVRFYDDVASIRPGDFGEDPDIGDGRRSVPSFRSSFA